MPRLCPSTGSGHGELVEPCSESSRSYPGRSVSHAMRPVLWKIPDRTTRRTKVPAYPVAIAGYERIIDSNTSRILIAPCRATCQVMRQKSADAIVVTQKRDEGLNTEKGRCLYELA